MCVLGNDARIVEFELCVDAVERVLAGSAVIFNVDTADLPTPIGKALLEASAADAGVEPVNTGLVIHLDGDRVAGEQVRADQCAVSDNGRDRPREPDSSCRVFDVVIHIPLLAYPLQQQPGALVMHEQRHLFTALDNVGLTQEIQ